MLLSTFDVDQGNIKSWAILDSGASSYFLCLDAPVTNKQIAKKTITVLQPDRDTMSSTHEGDLNLPQLPRAARRCHIILAIKHSLIYVVKLCEAGCEVKFIKWGVGIWVRHRGRLVLNGSLNKRTSLCMVPAAYTTPPESPSDHQTKSSSQFHMTPSGTTGNGQRKFTTLQPVQQLKPTIPIIWETRRQHTPNNINSRACDVPPSINGIAAQDNFSEGN